MAAFVGKGDNAGRKVSVLRDSRSNGKRMWLGHGTSWRRKLI